MRKAVMLLLALATALTLTACGGGGGTGNGGSNSNNNNAGGWSGGSGDASSNASDPNSGGSNDSGGKPSGPNNPAADEYFEALSWDGSAIEFTVIQQISVTGISVFAGSQEFEGKYVSNSDGNMGFPSGATMRPGSSVGFHGGLIIYAGTTARCEIDSSGARVDKVCFYLEGGQTLEREL